MSHKFDKETHRCKCGRWESGFAPKKEFSKPRAECQICERTQAVDADGTLGNHGYKRPGWGFIQGNCFGQGYRPYPATDALEAYKTAVLDYITKCQSELDDLPMLTSLPFQWEERVEGQRDRVKRTTDIIKSEPKPRCGQYCVPDFEDLLVRRKTQLENEIRFAEKDLERVDNRIQAAKGE